MANRAAINMPSDKCACGQEHPSHMQVDLEELLDPVTNMLDPIKLQKQVNKVNYAESKHRGVAADRLATVSHKKLLQMSADKCRSAEFLKQFDRASLQTLKTETQRRHGAASALKGTL